ncbi:MAG: efflux RND transporter permease subunit, partial [Gimesia chilikensis]
MIILFLFLMNFRTTFITLTAIPLSIAITAIIFAVFGLSINTMTLGGLAVAIGELVDDAIVDVENIFRRLQENRYRDNPKPTLLVVFQASCEIRNSIVFGTVIVVLVFLPLFALSGMEGRLFTPLGVAYIVSILSSLLVSLTLTPVLSYWLLGKKFGSPVQKTDTETDDHSSAPFQETKQWSIFVSVLTCVFFI